MTEINDVVETSKFSIFFQQSPEKTSMHFVTLKHSNFISPELHQPGVMLDRVCRQ
jgi:hypothetical protein